jgi:gliding motility-associated-like protein
VRYTFLIITLFFPFLAGAQLTAPGSRSVRYTSYPTSPQTRDPIFVYCNSSGSQTGTLTASVPAGSGVKNFSWYRWNDGTGSFSSLIQSGTGNSSTVTGLSEGGYRVIVSGGYDTIYTGWIVFDMPPFASARQQQQLCYRAALDGDTAAALHQFYYRDTGNGSTLALKNPVTFSWSADPATYIPAPELFLDPVIENLSLQPNREYRLPTTETTFTLTVSTLGCSTQASFLYQPIHAKADFTAEPINGDAPLNVTFTDNSIRANNKYIWDFGEKNADGSSKTWTVNKDSLWLFSQPFVHTYYRPGEYTVKLYVESDRFCTDTLFLETKIVVEPSKLEIPNVFTPDGDSNNDYFLINVQSLRFLSIEIYSRSGLRVYQFKGDSESLAQWQGWDGNINDSSVKASPGVYYYVIRAVGWDDVEYDSREQRGFFYLYR